MMQQKKLDLVQSDTQERYTEGTPILIEYKGLPERFTSSDVGGDVLFIESPIFDLRLDEAGRPIDETHFQADSAVFLDAYKVRQAFEAVDAGSEVSIRVFLSSVGYFWPGSHITLSQFRSWQTFVRLIRRADFELLTATDHEAFEASKALHGFPSDFFDFGLPDRPAELTRLMQEDSDSHARRTKYERNTLQARRKLPRYFESPPAFVRSCVKPEYIRQLALTKTSDEVNEALYPWRINQKDTMGVLVFRPKNALEAIAATIAADKLQGHGYHKCAAPECQTLFLRTKVSQKYCNPEECKGAARTTRRTATERSAAEFYVSQRKRGASRLTVERAATAADIHLTPRIIERSEKRLARERQKAGKSKGKGSR